MTRIRDTRQETSISDVTPGHFGGDVGTGGKVTGVAGFDLPATDPTDGELLVWDAGTGAWIYSDWSVLGGGGTGTPAWFNVKHYGALGDGTTDDTLAIQAAIDACSAAGGGIVYVPHSADSYLISAEASGQRYGIHMPSLVALQGDGMYVSVLEFDPGQTLPGGSIFIPIELGGASTSAQHIAIRDIGLDSHMTALGSALGPYIEGIAARQDGDVTKHVDDVVIERVYVLDANGAIYCCKDGAISGSGNTANRHRRWNVRDNIIDSSANKAIEMQQVQDFEVTGNTCVSCVDGLQAINYSVRGLIANNVVEYMAAGISVTEACDDIIVYGNVANCIGGAGTFVGGIILRREPFTGSVTFHRITVAYNIVNDYVSSEKIGLLFATFSGNTGVGTFEDLLIVGNVFNAQTSYLYDPYYPAKSAAPAMRVFDNRFDNVVNTSASWSSDRAQIHRNTFGAAFTANTPNWDFRENVFESTFTVVGSGITLDDGYVRNVLISATAPTAGQVLTASAGTAAAWATPSSVPAFAVPAITYGTPAAGAAATVIRSDAVIAKPAEADLNLTDLTTADVTSTKHGLAPKAPGDAKQFLNGAATPAWTTPPGAAPHVHVAYERRVSDGATVTWTLDQVYEPGSVMAWNSTTGHVLTVTEVQPDQVTLSAAGTAADNLDIHYAASMI